MSFSPLNSLENLKPSFNIGGKEPSSPSTAERKHTIRKQ